MMVTQDPAPVPPVICEHFVERKKRKCRMQALRASSYCAGHTALHDGPDASQRVPCPLDPAHYVSVEKMEQHMKICNANKYDYSAQPHYREDVNLPPVHAILDLPKVRLGEVPLPELIRVCTALLEYGSASRVCDVTTAPEVVESEVDKFRSLFIKPDNIGAEAMRHAVQQISLVNSFSDFQEELTGEGEVRGTCFVELGAGTGKLSQWLAHRDQRTDNFFVLVDRQICRNRADYYFKKGVNNYTRFKMDIKDIEVGKVAQVESHTSVCIACKHLCGGATDLALVAAARTAEHKPTSVLIALCCHHLCDWRSYVGKEYLLRHFSPVQFHMIRTLTAWATCFKIDKIRTHDTDFIAGEARKFLENPQNFVEGEHLSLDSSLQWHIGRCAKAVLNDGRADFMRGHGFTLKFISYVDVSISPENTAFLCYRTAADA